MSLIFNDELYNRRSGIVGGDEVVAAKAGMDLDELRAIVEDGDEPTLEEAIRIAQAVNYDVESLWELDDED